MSNGAVTLVPPGAASSLALDIGAVPLKIPRRSRVPPGNGVPGMLPPDEPILGTAHETAVGAAHGRTLPAMNNPAVGCDLIPPRPPLLTP